MTELLAAITLGLMGSFHCIGMCGPIALSLPVGGKNEFQKVMAVLVYNSGRIITYSLFGLITGLLGKIIAIAGFQQYLSITVGLLILISVLFPKLFSGISTSNNFFFATTSKIKNALGNLFKQKTNSSLFLIGLLNGLLPCGLVYMAIAGSLVTGDAFKGALFMSVFGLGTVPIMMLATFSRNLISLNVRNHLRKAVPYFISVMAVMLVLRGMNLGIPYLSPKANIEANTFASCHSASDNKVCCHKK